MSKRSEWLVYHCTDPQQMFSLQPQLWKERERYYQLVAVVEAEALEEVYHLTNHIECDWREMLWYALLQRPRLLPSRFAAC